MAEVDTTLPAWLNVKLSEPERAAAFACLNFKAPLARVADPDEEELQERIAMARERDAEVAALFTASREQRERMAKAAAIAAIPEESKERAKLHRKLKIKRFKPKMANDAAAKPKRRKRKPH